MKGQSRGRVLEEDQQISFSVITVFLTIVTAVRVRFLAVATAVRDLAVRLLGEFSLLALGIKDIS